MRRQMKKRVLGLIALAALAGPFVGWRLTDSEPAQAAAPAPPFEVPVTTAAAQVQDVPVFLDGLGTVQALNTVEIKAEVNGTLIAIPPREGQEVHKGDVIAEIDPRTYQASLDQAMAQRDEDVATLRSAQLDLTRFKNLAKSNFAPIQQVDDQQATVDKQIAAISVDNALIETARINLGYCVIRAPFDGRVGLHQLDVGNLVEVASQTGIISLTQDKPISVVFTLPEADLARVQDAQARGPVPVQAANTQNQQRVANGTLLTPNNTIDPTTGTISLKANFGNNDDRLWPGQFVDARVQVDTLHKAVVVPLPAVQHGPDGLFVYVVKPDQTVAQANVELGYQDDGKAVVSHGLSGNETVVLSGQSRLSPGVRVKATDAPVASQTPTQTVSDNAPPT
ncbi:MAG: rane fusion protein multidrug efflux system [Acetobacteraceae bacterium]|jgi:multidrug efflux system membrane fusion protein|nr:rane fusion protein multidrug efflux system [Acetobacteraceae bacterium]